VALIDRIRAACLPPPDVCKAIRVNADVSLQDIADDLDVSAMTVWRWENGKASPRSRETATAYRTLLDGLMGTTS
jgi:transcriptional regulator with XRE-family HTH domain